MKQSILKQLIKEEIQKIIKEENSFVDNVLKPLASSISDTVKKSRYTISTNISGEKLYITSDNANYAHTIAKSNVDNSVPAIVKRDGDTIVIEKDPAKMQDPTRREGLEGPVMGVDHKKARSEEEASQLEKQGYQRVDKRNPSYKYRDEKGEYIPLVKKLNEKKKFPDLTGDGKVTKADILKGRGVKLK